MNLAGLTQPASPAIDVRKLQGAPSCKPSLSWMSPSTRMVRLAALVLALGSLATAAAAQTRGGEAAAGAMDPEQVVRPVVEESVRLDPQSGRLQARLPLAKYIPEAGPMMLRFSSDAENVFFPLSERFVVDNLRLHLDLVNSIALLRERSILSIRLNEATVSQFRLDPDQPLAVVDVDLPVELLRPGFNKLTLAVSQHYTNEFCEYPLAPELWTEIQTGRSFLEFGGRLDSRETRLSDLDNLFGPGLGAVGNLAVVTAPVSGSGAAGREVLKAAGLAAQALALRRDYEPLRFAHWELPADGPLRTVDGPLDRLLIGTRAQLAGHLPAGLELPGSGAALALAPAADRPGGTDLVISGDRPEELVTAATALLAGGFPFADSRTMTVAGITALPEAEPMGSRSYLRPGRSYTFSELGLDTVTVRGSRAEGRSIRIRMPADVYPLEDAQATMWLDLAYGPGMGPGSVMKIRLNDRLVGGISFDDPRGERFNDYRIPIPFRDFAPGENVLSFEPVMQKEDEQNYCTDTYGGYLAATLFGSSRIVFDKADFVAAQPDLRLFRRTGFPYVRPFHESDLTLRVTEPGLLAAGLGLLGKLAQSADMALPDAELAVTAPASLAVAGNEIVLAPVDDLPPALFRHVDYAVGEMHRIPYPALQRREGSALAMAAAGPVGWLESLFGADETDGVLDFDTPARASPDGRPRDSGFVSQQHELGRLAVLTAMRAPGPEDATVTVVTADTADRLAAGVDRLLEPAVWQQVDGDMAVWRVDGGLTAPQAKVSFVTVADSYQIGRGDLRAEMRHSVTLSPWLWIGVTLAAILLLAWLTTSLVRRRHRKRLAE